MFFYFILLFYVGSVFAQHREERLLLNDPALIMDRLTKLENTVQQQAATIQSQATEIRRLQSQYDTFNSTANVVPAFFAVLSTTLTFGHAEILKFNDVKTNIGGGYDYITGVFVAPKSGVYQFISVIYSSGSDDTFVQLNINNNLLIRGYSTGATHAESHSMNAIVSVNKGDHIYVKHRTESSDAVLGDSHSTFSGFMISE